MSIYRQYTADAWTMLWLGSLTYHEVKNPCIMLQLVPHTHSSTSTDTVMADHVVLKYLPLKICGASLVVQWLRMHLAMQNPIRVWSLIRKIPYAVDHWATVYHSYWAHVLQLLKPVHLEPVLVNKRSPHTTTREQPHSPQLEKVHA